MSTTQGHHYSLRSSNGGCQGFKIGMLFRVNVSRTTH
uniref:Uncharacterized protein n=1 Tax=Arundo donax TaxID=35708 RepID=A0A0A9AV21_ARUDO